MSEFCPTCGQPDNCGDCTHDGYTDRPTRIRVFSDGWEGREWFIDGADNEGRYTEACWSADTFAEALAMIPEFIENTTLYGGVEWNWDTTRPRSARGLRGIEVGL